MAGSIPRFQSLAMLRFALCGHEVMEYPMDDKHMFFLRNAMRLSPGCLRSAVLLMTDGVVASREYTTCSSRTCRAP